MLKELMLLALKDTITRIEAGECEMSLELMEDIVKTFAHLPLSKALACNFLGISRSLFDNLVKNGNLPKGLKRVGFKELVYYKDELELYLN